MSLRERLEAFDRLSPDDSLYRRALEGPRRDAPRLVDPTRSRFMAGAVAVCVFLAAGVFAWNALGGPDTTAPNETRPAVASFGQDGSVLWPERTATELRRLQEELDDGRGPDRWLLDQGRVVETFADHVLGWPTGSYSVIVDPSGDSQQLATLTRDSASCASLSDINDLPPCYPGSEQIRIGQPVRSGEGGIWVVVDVRAPTLSLDVSAGQIVPNGGSVTVSLTASDPVRTVVGSLIGDWSDGRNCGTHSGETLLRDPGGSIEVSIAPDRQAGTDCGQVAPGYAWAASASWHASAGVNPMNGDSTPYTAVTAVPIVVSIPQNMSAPNTSTYTDPFGWRVDVPQSWFATTISTQGGVSIEGTEFSNFAVGASASPSGSNGLQGSNGVFPANGIVVSITHREGGPAPDLLSDDSKLPVTLGDLGCALQTEVACEEIIRANGLDYTVSVRRGADLSADDLGRAETLVASLGFPSVPSGKEAHGWTSLGRSGLYPDGRGTSTWVDAHLGVAYVMRGPNGIYALDLDPEGCGEGENETWDESTLQIWIRCPWSGDVRYDRFGEPDPRNDSAFSTPLDAYPVIKAWDGSLLVDAAASIEGLPQQMWP
jgi:hypothetical protein